MHLLVSSLNGLVSLRLQFADPSKEPGGPDGPEGRQLERWLLLNPKWTDVQEGGRCQEGPVLGK